VIYLRIVRVRAEFQTEKCRRRYHLKHRDRSVGRSVCLSVSLPLNVALNSTKEKCSFFCVFNW